MLTGYYYIAFIVGYLFNRIYLFGELIFMVLIIDVQKGITVFSIESLPNFLYMIKDFSYATPEGLQVRMVEDVFKIH